MSDALAPALYTGATCTTALLSIKAHALSAARTLANTCFCYSYGCACSYYMEVDLKCFSGHRSLHSLERYLAENREAAKRKARERERQTDFQ
jgi:hypothetical protein